MGEWIAMVGALRMAQRLLVTAEDQYVTIITENENIFNSVIGKTTAKDAEESG